MLDQQGLRSSDILPDSKNSDQTPIVGGTCNELGLSIQFHEPAACHPAALISRNNERVVESSTFVASRFLCMITSTDGSAGACPPRAAQPRIVKTRPVMDRVSMRVLPLFR